MNNKVQNLGWGQKRDSVSSFLQPSGKGEEAVRGRAGLCGKAAAQSTLTPRREQDLQLPPKAWGWDLGWGGSGPGPSPAAPEPCHPTSLRAAELAASQGSLPGKPLPKARYLLLQMEKAGAPGLRPQHRMRAHSGGHTMTSQQKGSRSNPCMALANASAKRGRHQSIAQGPTAALGFPPPTKPLPRPWCTKACKPGIDESLIKGLKKIK